MNNYRTFVDNRSDPDFGRTNLGSRIETGPFYAVRAEPALHTSFGGIVVDSYGRVLNAQGNHISGLYAAGECVATHWQMNQTLTAAVVFGRIATETAIRGF